MKTLRTFLFLPSSISRPTPRLLRSVAILGLAVGQTVLPSRASATTPSAPATDEQPVVLDPVEVRDSALTAASDYRVATSAATGFRAQPVLDTPFSVAGFSADFIQDVQARTLLDLTRNDPSVSPAEDPLFYDRVNIRGFYLSTNAVFRDGLGINDQGTIALENKEAVELTKGLSSSRQGVTSPGGTINYVVKRPLDAPLTRATAFGDGFGGFGGSADVSRRFGPDDRFGVRVNVAAEEIRSFVDAVEGERTFASAAFDWRATDRLLLEFEVERQDKEITSAGTLGFWSFPDIAAARALFPLLRPEIRQTQPWAVEPNEQLYYSGRATFEISDAWRVRLVGQRGELHRDQRGISASNIQPNGDYDIDYYFNPDQDRNNTAVLALIEGDIETGPVLHELAFGYDYIRRDMTASQGEFFGTIGSGNLFNDVVVPDPNPVVGPSALFSRSNQHSVFLTNNARFGDFVRLYGGARLTRLQNLNGALVETYDKTVFTPTLGAVYKPVPKLSLYASYAEGIERGGTAAATFGPFPVTNANTVLDPLDSEQYELGLKYELPSGALLTASAFRINKGLEYYTVNGGAATFVQDGRQVHDGVELTLGGNIFPELRVIAGLAYLDAEIQDSDTPALVGKRPAGVPEWQANLYADYDLAVLADGLSINAGLYYTGEKPIDDENTWSADSYVRLDAGLRYRHRIGETTTATWRVSVENVTDEVYLANTTFGYLNFGAPRTVKFSATFDF